MKDDIAGFRLQPNERQHVTELHAGPFANRTPSLDAIVARDLCATRHRAQLRQREFGGSLHQPVDQQLPVLESARRQRLVGGVLGVRSAIAAELRRQVGLSELLSHRASRGHEMLSGTT